MNDEKLQPETRCRPATAQPTIKHPTPARRAGLVLAGVLVLAGLVVLGCGSDTEIDQEPVEGVDLGPEVTAQQAGAAVADAMLVTSHALYLAIATPTDSREVATSDRSLVLSWSEDADFLTGAGRYEIRLDEFSIPEDEPFAAHYNGYVLTGTIVLASQTGETTSIVFDLASSHPRAADFPARRIQIALSGVASDADPADPERREEETALVNGRPFSLEELSASF